LKWFSEKEEGWTEIGADMATTWTAAKNQNWLAQVYPLKLINKAIPGYEYKIFKMKEGQIEDEWDSRLESSVGGDHARTAEKAMAWAESTLEDFVKERKIR